MKRHICFSPAVRRLFVIALLLFPVAGNCDWSSSVTELFGSKGKNMKEVATKIATLSEENDILGLDFSPDGKHLAATPFDAATVHIWDWQGNRLERTLERAKGSNVTVTEPVRYSPDGKLLAICHTPGRTSHIIARIWSADTWSVVHDIIEQGSGGCDAIGFTSDGKSLIRVMSHNAWGFAGENFVIYDTFTWQSIWKFSTEPVSPETLAISPDNRLAAIAGSVVSGGAGLPITTRTQIAIVDLTQRKVVQVIPIDDTSSVGRLAWSPDGVNIAYGYAGGVAIFDVNTVKRIEDEVTEQRRKPLIRYTPDGKYFIESNFGEHGAKVRIWDGQHKQLLQEIKAIAGCIAVSRDGRYMAMGGDKKIIVWQLK